MEKQRVAPTNKSALGKGLASLLPTSAAMPAPPTESTSIPKVETTENRDRHLGISMCAIEEIEANPYQPRHSFDDVSLIELSDSIKANGLIQPLIVRKSAKGYQLIAGERRLRAAKLAGLKQIPIVIRRTTDKEALELALIENIQREDLHCIDTALAYYQLIHDFDLKQDEVSDRVGKDRASVANYLRLLKLPTSIQEKLKSKDLSFGHGKALLGIEEASMQERLAQDAVENKWSVRELEAHIQRIKNLQAGRDTQSDEKNNDPVFLRLKTLGKQATQKLSTKVVFRGDGNKGKVIIEYFNPQDLDRVVDHLLNH